MPSAIERWPVPQCFTNIPASGQTMSPVLQAALNYAARGWQAFPLKPRSKEPATKRGLHDATTNPETLRRWFGRGFPYNIGVRTGLASGVFVVDLDGAEGITNIL